MVGQGSASVTHLPRTILWGGHGAGHRGGSLRLMLLAGSGQGVAGLVERLGVAEEKGV